MKGKSPCGNSMHTGGLGRNAIFTVNWEQKAVNMEHLAPSFFSPTKRGEFGNPKLKEPNFPTDRFSVKLLLSNASRPKSSKMKTMLQTFAKNWSSLEGSMSNGPNHQSFQNTASFSLFNMDHVKCPNNWLQIIGYPWPLVNVPC